MATGIPKTQRKRKLSIERSKRPQVRPDISICYEGKREEQEILSIAPAALRQLWPKNQIEAPRGNHLYYGDNLPILAAIRQDPSICGHIRCIYIDPPYATGGVFQSRSQKDAYDDLLIGAHYVEFLRERLILLREVLADDGCIYVHLDKNMAFAIKMVMDEVFGPKNFRAWITRKKCNPKNYTSKTYGNVADFVLFYSKGDTYVWNRPTEPWTDGRDKEYQYIDEGGRRFMKVPVHAPGVRNGATGQPWRGKLPPPGKHWQYPPATLDELDAKGEIFWSANGNPRRKVYLDESKGIPVQDIWMEFRDAHNQNIHITGFPTEKNPDLLARIINASTNPGDLVLDCFCGSGTTLSVASQLERRWIGIDASAHAIATTLRRFARGVKPMGDFVGKRGRKEMEAEQTRLFSTNGQVVDDFTVITTVNIAETINGSTPKDSLALAKLFDKLHDAL